MSWVLFNTAEYKRIMVLSPISGRLFFFAATQMDEGNILVLSPDIKQGFIRDMRECGKRISMQSIHNSVNELKKSGVFTEVSRGTYRISRRIFSKVHGGAE